jgi:hypothetical protein
MKDSFRNMPWLFWIQKPWLTFSHCAEAAMACADIATQHEGGRAIRPTLKNVRTTSFLTDGVQV